MIRTLIAEDIPHIVAMVDRVRVKLPNWYPQLSLHGCISLYYAKEHYHFFEVCEEDDKITGVLLAYEGWPIFQNFAEVIVNQFLTETDEAARGLYESLLRFCRTRGKGRLMFATSSGLPAFLTTKNCPGLKQTGVLFTEDF